MITTQTVFVEKGLETFKQMQLASVDADCTTFLSVISICAKCELLNTMLTLIKA